MAKIRDLPLNNYPSGTFTFNKKVPNGLNGFQAAIGRCTDATPTLWPDPAAAITVGTNPVWARVV